MGVVVGFYHPKNRNVAELKIFNNATVDKG